MRTINRVKFMALLPAMVLAAIAAASPRAGAAQLEVGQQAPGFTLPDENGRMTSLSDFKGKTVVIAFYPKDFTGG